MSGFANTRLVLKVMYIPGVFEIACEVVHTFLMLQGTIRFLEEISHHNLLPNTLVMS